MPVAPTYPGVYIEEIPSGVRTITGVATSITAFVGRAQRGPVNEPTEIFNFGDFERKFGGLWANGPMSYAVRDFYLNGGGQAIIVRLFDPAFKSEADRKAIEDAAKAIAAATTGTDAATAAANARTKADEYKGKPEESAANTVASKAESAAKATGATPESVKKAVEDMIDDVSPITTKRFKVDTIPLEAASSGAWGNGLRAEIDLEVSKEVANRLDVEERDLFNLTVRDVGSGAEERFINLSLKESSNRIDRVLEQSSNLVRWSGEFPGDAEVPSTDAATPENDANASPPDPNDSEETSTVNATDSTNQEDAEPKIFRDPIGEEEYKLVVAQKALAKAKIENSGISEAEQKVKDAQEELDKVIDEQGTVTDGKRLEAIHFVGSEDDKTGIYALEKTDLFNLLCIPADIRGDDTPTPVYEAALTYCVKRRAMLVVDPPKAWSANKETAASTAKKGLSAGHLGISGPGARNAVLYFPRVRYPDPLRDGQIDTFVPCGMMAGVMARTDAQRGVWKAPAGIDAALNGTQALEVNLTNDENGLLNPLGINCLRSFPVIGRVAWGARTMRGADLLADEYKYLPVRRTALFIEESLYRGTQWVVFEPNDEPLWAQIRLNVGAFMNNLFRQGAFQGSTPKDAYLVKCDKETTTQNDINLGIVNIVVGFAPLKPAEFVIIKLQQLAGQIDV